VTPEPFKLRPVSDFFPLRCVIQPGVVNALTCPHRRNQRCRCAALPHEAAAAQPAPGTSANGTTAAAAAEPTVLLADADRFFRLMWEAVRKAVYPFPDAVQALRLVLDEYTQLYPGPFGAPACSLHEGP